MRLPLLNTSTCRRLAALCCLLISGALSAQQSSSIEGSGGLEGLQRGNALLETIDGHNDLQPLAPEEAFRMQASYKSGRLTLDWQVEPGYYLYRQSFKVSEVNLGAASFSTLPEGETIEDPFFGEVAIYRQQVQTVLNAHPNPVGRLSLQIEFQGCAESRYCYPVMTRQLDVHVR